jgi:protein-disulfide isomerase
MVTGLTVRRELMDSGRAASLKPVEVENWTSLIGGGHRRGPLDADVVILEFGDFECPACSHFATSILSPIMRKYPDHVAHVFRHWPLDYHRMALPAAEAAECAGQQGRFFEFHDALFVMRDSLGLRPFSRFAEDAGVSDAADFEECLRQPGPLRPAIERDIAAAAAAGGSGTPTIIVNGLRLPETPTVEELEAYVIEAMESKR